MCYLRGRQNGGEFAAPGGKPFSPLISWIGNPAPLSSSYWKLASLFIHSWEEALLPPQPLGSKPCSPLILLGATLLPSHPLGSKTCSPLILLGANPALLSSSGEETLLPSNTSGKKHCSPILLLRRKSCFCSILLKGNSAVLSSSKEGSPRYPLERKSCFRSILLGESPAPFFS